MSRIRSVALMMGVAGLVMASGLACDDKGASSADSSTHPQSTQATARAKPAPAPVMPAPAPERFLAQPKLLLKLIGHTDEVTSAAFSPDGRSLVTGSRDNTARLWDVASGEQTRAFKGHTNYVTSVAFSPDGRSVVTGSGDETARIWDAANGKQIQTFEGHSDWVASAAFSPDGRSVVTGSSDKTAILWDVATGKQIRVIEGPNLVSSAVFSTDVRSRGGLAWFPLLNSAGQVQWQHNAAYTFRPITLKRPRHYTEFAIDPSTPIYQQFADAPDRFQFISRPDPASLVKWEAFTP